MLDKLYPDGQGYEVLDVCCVDGERCGRPNELKNYHAKHDALIAQGDYIGAYDLKKENDRWEKYYSVQTKRIVFRIRREFVTADEKVIPCHFLEDSGDYFELPLDALDEQFFFNLGSWWVKAIEYWGRRTGKHDNLPPMRSHKLYGENNDTAKWIREGIKNYRQCIHEGKEYDPSNFNGYDPTYLGRMAGPAGRARIAEWDQEVVLRFLSKSMMLHACCWTTEHALFLMKWDGKDVEKDYLLRLACASKKLLHWDPLWSHPYDAEYKRRVNSIFSQPGVWDELDETGEECFDDEIPDHLASTKYQGWQFRDMLRIENDAPSMFTEAVRKVVGNWFKHASWWVDGAIEATHEDLSDFIFDTYGDVFSHEDITEQLQQSSWANNGLPRKKNRYNLISKPMSTHPS